MDGIGPSGENTLEVLFISIDYSSIGPINNRALIKYRPTNVITHKMRFMYINGFNLEACQI